MDFLRIFLVLSAISLSGCFAHEAPGRCSPSVSRAPWGSTDCDPYFESSSDLTGYSERMVRMGKGSWRTERRFDTPVGPIVIDY